MKKKYILLKDTPEFKKGTIFEEKCEDGDQSFYCQDKSFFKSDDLSLGDYYYSRKTIMKQPEWFEEIYQVEVPKRHIIKVKKFIKSLK